MTNFTLEHEKRLANALEEIRRYCKNCGHSQNIPRYRNSCVCKQCGCRIYYDDLTEFKEKMKMKLLKAEFKERMLKR